MAARARRHTDGSIGASDVAGFPTFQFWDVAMSQGIDPSGRPTRRTLRLRDYDYTTPAGYFVTLCVEQRRCVFGRIRDGRVDPSPCGVMIARWWAETARAFPQVVLDESVVMPNHLHGIIGLTDLAPALGRIIGWFKTMTTNEYFRAVRAGQFVPVGKRLWQRNYFEHIIRGPAALDRIRDYIAENPVAWETDPENNDRIVVRHREAWER